MGEILILAWIYTYTVTAGLVMLVWKSGFEHEAVPSNPVAAG